MAAETDQAKLIARIGELEAEAQKMRQQMVAYSKASQEREKKIRDILSQHMRKTLEAWRKKAAGVMADKESRIRQLQAELDSSRTEVNETRRVAVMLQESMKQQTGIGSGSDDMTRLEERLAGLEDKNLAALAAGRRIAAEAYGGPGPKPGSSARHESIPDPAEQEAAKKALLAELEKQAAEEREKMQAEKEQAIKEAEEALKKAKADAEARVKAAKEEAAKAADAARAEAQLALDAVLSETEAVRDEKSDAQKMRDELESSHQAALDAVLAEAERTRAEQDKIRKERDELKKRCAELEGYIKKLGG